MGCALLLIQNHQKMSSGKKMGSFLSPITGPLVVMISMGARVTTLMLARSYDCFMLYDLLIAESPVRNP